MVIRAVIVIKKEGKAGKNGYLSLIIFFIIQIYSRKSNKAGFNKTITIGKAQINIT